jgi:hypothetical protein
MAGDTARASHEMFPLVFISRARAHYIPIKDVTDPDFFERLQMVAAESTEFD